MQIILVRFARSIWNWQMALLILSSLILIGCASSATHNLPTSSSISQCIKWWASVDPSLPQADRIDATEISEEDFVEAAECLLEMQGRMEKGRYCGAIKQTSFIVESCSIEIDSLYFISYLYTQNWEHGSVVALMGKDGAINDKRDIAAAFKAYRLWLDIIKKNGIKYVKSNKIGPLDGTGIDWL